jgi:hypothetical protein
LEFALASPAHDHYASCVGELLSQGKAYAGCASSDEDCISTNIQIQLSSQSLPGGFDLVAFEVLVSVDWTELDQRVMRDMM